MEMTFAFFGFVLGVACALLGFIYLALKEPENER